MDFSSVKLFFFCSLETAVNAGAEFNLSPVFIIAVSALETGYGSYSPGNNFFGIKAGRNWKGKKITAHTREYKPGKGENYIRVKDTFRAYSGFEESCRDFCMLITKRYPQCVGVMDESVCDLIQSNPAFRYSTYPGYSTLLKKVYKIMEKLQTNQA